MPGVSHTLATVGNSADKSVNNASVYVKLSDIDQRQLTQQQLMQRTRDLMKTFPPEIHTGVELVSSVGGNQSNNPGATNSKDTLLPITELEAGFEYTYRGSRLNPFVRLTAVDQTYFNLGSSTHDSGNLSLFGVQFTAGLNY